MKNADFTEKQINGLKDFLKVSRGCMKRGRIDPVFLLYAISNLPGEKSSNIFTKSNIVLLRDTIPKKRRIRLDYLIRLLKQEEGCSL